MEFDKSRVFTALNADKLRTGDKVIVAKNLADLRKFIITGGKASTLIEVASEDNYERFIVKGVNFPLAFLVEQKAEKGLEEHKSMKQKNRPFKDVDELIGVWQEKCPSHNNREKALTMPLIWVRKKLNFSGLKGEFITRFEDSYVDVNGRTVSLHVLFTEYEFLDGSICGVEE